MDDVPNKPVKSGRSGWLMLRFKEAIPKNPDKIKIIIERVICFESDINKMQIQTKIQGIIVSKNG